MKSLELDSESTLPPIVFFVGSMNLYSYRIYVVAFVIVEACLYFVGPMLTSYESTHTSNHLHSFHLDKSIIFHLSSWLYTGTAKGQKLFSKSWTRYIMSLRWCCRTLMHQAAALLLPEKWRLLSSEGGRKPNLSSVVFVSRWGFEVFSRQGVIW